MKFRSKIDHYFVVVISITIIVILAVFLLPLIFDHERRITDTIIVLSLCVLTVGFVLWTAFSNIYVFYQDYLLVKGGLFQSRIPYEEIIRISPTKEILTGYRLLSSNDGLELFYKTAILGSVKISPKDKELFISEIKKRCPNAQIDL
ncbi:PH domain-containing protein [Rummeliibacillus sp. JY-2-4R]